MFAQSLLGVLEMATLRLVAVAAAVGLLCSGCGTYWQRQAESVYQGQPQIKDQAFLLQKSAPDLPEACRHGDPNAWVMPADKDRIRACTVAMKLLIDIRWAHYSDALHGTAAYGAMALDTVSLGLNTAGALTPGSATQVLSAVAAGVGGLKTKIEQDILYQNSVLLVLMQMQKDRAIQARIILTNLDGDKYRTMIEAAIDLYAYDRAGSWTNALISMQADSGNNAADRTTELQQFQRDAAKEDNTTPPAPAAVPTPNP
jgi:hypothetical protein